jgi:chromosomal replication initiation ATPase DnaA
MNYNQAVVLLAQPVPENYFEIVQRKKAYNITQRIQFRNKLRFDKQRTPVNFNLPEIENGDIAVIANIVCADYDIKPEHIKARCRSTEILLPRQIVQYISKKLYVNLTHSYIASQTGVTDHSTVINSIKAIQNRMDTNKEFKEKVEGYILKINNLSIPCV